jgi:hypothetical protein
MNITANGGQGGIEDDGLNINKCYASGGGGSGGVIYFSGSVPGGIVATASAGNAGPEINHDVSCSAAVPSSPGLAGQVITGYTFRSSLVLSNSYCTSLLPVELVSFSAYFNAGKVLLSWKTVQPELVDHFVIERSDDAMQWSERNTLVADAAKTVYGYEDLSPVPGNNFYRIKIFRKNNAVSYSGVRKVIVPPGSEVIAIYPNPASGKIFVSGLNSSSSFMVFDQMGKLIFEKKIIATQHIIEVDLPVLPKGVYLIRVGETVKRLSIY